MKACVVYLDKLKERADVVASKLTTEGYEVCLEEVDFALAQAILEDNSAIPARISDCIKTSDVCILLLGQDETDEAFGSIGGVGADGGCRVIAVTDQSAEELAKGIDTFVDAIVPCDLEDIVDVIGGKEKWPSDSTGKPIKRDLKRVKCQ